MVLRDYNYTGYPYSYEEQLMRRNAPLNANVAGFGAWLRHPFNKNKRINAGFQEDTGSFNAPITDYNTTGNGTTDWNSGFVTGQMQQEQFTRPQSNQLNLTMDSHQSNTEDNPIVEMNSGNVEESNNDTQGFNIGGSWGNAIAPAATNIANAFADTESPIADRVAGALGIPMLSKIWRADTTKGDANLKLAQQNLDNFNKNYIQDASSSWGAANAIKLNNKPILPISNTNLNNVTLRDFRGNMFMKGAAATAQGAASGSVGGPWGALGGAVTGTLGALFGGIGAKKRAQRAYDDYINKLGTIMSAQKSAYKQAMTNQSLSNMQALANGNMSQRINEMANIRAYGGNLFDDGGDLTDEQQMVLADIQADPRILFTPKYSQWRDYIRRTSPDYLDRLYTSLPYEQQQDIYQNDREAWGALSNEAKGNFGGAQVRKKTDEVSPYVAGALGLVGAAPAMEAISMFPMLENGLNAYFGYEGAKNLPTAVTDAYDYAKKGDWSRAGLSAGEAVLDGLFVGNGIKGVKNLSELSGLSDRVYNTFPILDPYTTSGATFGYHGASALDRLLGTISRRNGFTYKPEIPEFHRRMNVATPEQLRFTEDGKLILSSGRTGEGHDNIINFATSEPARGHKSHKTLSGIDDFIVNPEALKNQEFISIEPSDTFFETGELAVNPKDITLVSGNTKLLDYAKSKGFNTLSSPRLREYYKKNYTESTTSGKNSNKFNITKEGANVSPRDVGDEIQRLTSKRGAPTLEDYRFFESETGLPSGVVPIEKYNAVGQQTLYGHSPSLRANLNWNNVAYDPATKVESLYRKAKINPDDAEAAKKYNDYIDNLKKINSGQSAKIQNDNESHSNKNYNFWGNALTDIKNAYYDLIIDPFLQKVGEFRGYPKTPSLSDKRFYTEKPIPEDVKQNFVNNVKDRYYRSKVGDYKRKLEYATEDLNTFKTEDHAPSFKEAYENMLNDEINNLKRLSDPNFIDNLANGTYYEYTPVQASLHGGEFGLAHYNPNYDAIVAGTRRGGVRMNGPHEIRHRMQYLSGYEKPNAIIDKAFTSTFDKAVSSKYGLSSVGSSLEKETTLLDTRNNIIGDRMWSEYIPLEEQIKIIDSKTDKEILKALEDSNGYGYYYVKELKKNPKECNDAIKALRDALKYSAAITPPVVGGLMLNNNNYNNTEYAMGGNLYTDLSPNMMNLWNNKQQIDQQKAMNQQFSLGLGNSSLVNKFETGGPVNPPEEFMDRYHPDWGNYTPEYADLNYDDFMNVYWNGFGDEGDYLKYNPSEYNRYKYRKYLNYPNKNTLQNSYLFLPTYEELDKKYDDSDLPIYKDKDGQYYLKAGIGYNNIGNTNEDLVKWMGSNYDEYSRRVNAANGDIRLGLTKDEYDKYVLNRNDGNKRIEASKYDPKKHRGYIPVQDYNDWYADEINRVKHELKSRAFTNEFYAWQEVADYNARNINSAPYTPNEKALRARQRKQEVEEQDRRTTTAIPSSKSSVNKVNKATTVANKQNSSPINNMTFQQMEDYYGQKQSPLLNAQYKNTWANGGQMTSADVPNGMQYYANGGTHEENPYGGIQVGTDQQGNANLVEKGEFRWHDFVFSDRVNVDANLLSSFNLMPATKHQNKKAAKGKLSYADMAKKYAKRNKELENDPITKNSMEAFMQRLANAQEYQKKAEQLEAQKQNELQDYKTALNKQNNNPMYGTMKYNGMGNVATQQGVNSGVDVGMGNPMSNADLSNVNRSGNEMMAAYGGNLFAGGGPEDPNPYEWTLDNLNARQVITPWNNSFIGPTLGNNTDLNITPNTDNYRWGDIAPNTPFYQNEGWGIDMRPTYIKVKNPRYNAPAVSTYATRDESGKIVYDPNGKPFMSYPRTYEGMKSSDYTNTKVIGKTVDNYGFYLPNAIPESIKTTPVTTPEISDDLIRLSGNTYIPITLQGISNGVPYTGNIGATDTQNNLTRGTNVSNKVVGKTTPNTNPDAAVSSDPKEAPLYSTAGKYAQFGKGIMPLVWDWANKTNVKYDPYYRDADRLEALANEGPALRTADTIGGYRAPDLMDVERLNNSARAEGLAQLQAAFNIANGNRGFAGVQSAQNNYNTQMGIGNNYAKTQEINNANRLQTDQFNHAIDVANQNAINTMRQDNQRAEQAQQQLAVSGTAQAAALRQRENIHADEVNTERMKNRAANQAAYVDNALNYFTTQAMENQELNARNNDPTNPYWIDKDGRVHYTGDSGLTQAIRDAFGNDEYGRNGTFTGERLAEWNDLIKNKKYSAKYLKEHPELWEHLVIQQREVNRIDAEKAKQAKLEELEALRGTYQSNLARLNALKDSGAIISDPSYNLYAGWANEDYSGNQGLLRTRNQALDQYIAQIGNNYDRYLYEKQLAQNKAKALGGYLNGGQNNNNNYYSYTRI